MLTAIIITASTIQVLLALFILLKDRKNLSYIFFFLIGVVTAGWAVSNYLTTTYLQSDNLIYLVRLILLMVVLQNYFFCLFATYFPDKNFVKTTKWLMAYTLFSLLVLGFVVSPFVFVSVEVKGEIALTKAGPGIVLFITHAAYSIIRAFRQLINKYKKSSGSEKNQLRILIFASVLNWVVVPFTNFALTPLLKTTFFIRLSPIYTLLFAAIIAYAIVAKRLFDIKLVVARSVAYILAVGLLAVGYASASSFLVNNTLPSGESEGSLNLIINTGIFLIAVIAFPRIKKFFDKATNKLFFRDVYDLQEVLDKIGNIIVSEMNLHKILRDVRNILENATKSTRIDFLLMGEKEPLVVTKHNVSSLDPYKEIKVKLRSVSQDLIIRDELSNKELREDLSQIYAELSLRLRTNQQVIGYMFIGGKKSGDSFSARDRSLFVITANELAVAVQNALRFEEIQNFTATLEDRVKKATSKLQSSNRKLKELDETKDEFISMASHQLRTPLTSVKGYLSMVLEGDAGKLTSMQRKLLKQAFVSSQRMVFLIADLLNVSRLKTGKFIIESVPTDLSQIVSDEIEQLSETAEGRGLTLSYKKPDSFPELMLDETKMRQVIMNFIDNAIYYTQSGGKIEVILSQTDSSVELRVKDDGIGVPKAERHHLFSKFYRAGNARKARPDGTGLGLFMAKKVIVAQGGSIIFSSKEGKGSTFGFVFSKNKLKIPHSDD